MHGGSGVRGVRVEVRVSEELGGAGSVRARECGGLRRNIKQGRTLGVYGGMGAQGCLCGGGEGAGGLWGWAWGRGQGLGM